MQKKFLPEDNHISQSQIYMYIKSDKVINKEKHEMKPTVGAALVDSVLPYAAAGTFAPSLLLNRGNNISYF
jgi:hypothetical protein